MVWLLGLVAKGVAKGVAREAILNFRIEGHKIVLLRNENTKVL